MDKTHLKFLPLKLSVWLCSELVGAVAGHSELNIYVKRRFYLTKGAYHKSSLFQSSCSGQGTLWQNFLSFGRMLNPCPLTLRAVWKTKTFCCSAVFELKAWPVASLWVLGEAKAAPALPVASADPFRRKQEPRGREGKALTNPCLSAVLFSFADSSHLKPSANLMSTFHLSVWQLSMSDTSAPPLTHICSSYSAVLEETQAEIGLWEMLLGFWVFLNKVLVLKMCLSQ